MQKIDIYEYDTSVYSLTCRSLGLAGINASVLSCSVAPGQEAEAHNHFERELFIFIQGSGTFTGGGRMVRVQAGEAVLCEAFEPHVIKNDDAHTALRFVSLYWPASHSVSESQTGTQCKLLVISTPPTPNGDLHLGHLAGPYLAADMLKRARALAGQTALHVSGRDDHQNYVLTKARAAATAPEEIAERYAGRICETWKRADIVLDGFIVPERHSSYAAFVRAGIRRLFEDGYIIAREEPAAFDRDGDYLHEATISGRCPHCGSGSDGNACEACGRPNQCVDLIEPISQLSGAIPEIRPCRRLYFRLSAWSEALARHVRTSALPARVLNLSLSMIEDGLPDICVSHPSEWGIHHDIEGFEDQIVYVWFEMAFGYLWAASKIDEQGGTDPYESATRVFGGSHRVVHCYGFDNAYYHALLFPAVYLALGIAPPERHIVNELLDLEDSKFSTSRGHAIWGSDLMDQLPADYVRFALVYDRPEGMSSDFSLPICLDLLNSLFPGALRRWLAGLRAALGGAAGEIVEDPGAWLPDQVAYFHALLTHARQLADAMTLESFSARDVARTMATLIIEGARFQAAQQILFDRQIDALRNYRRTATALSLAGLRTLAAAAVVVTPSIGGALHRFLGLGGAAMLATDERVFLPAGHALAPGTPISLPPAAASRTPCEHQT